MIIIVPHFMKQALLPLLASLINKKIHLDVTHKESEKWRFTWMGY
jgi:hypothetical protein